MTPAAVMMPPVMLMPRARLSLSLYLHRQWVCAWKRLGGWSNGRENRDKAVDRALCIPSRTSPTPAHSGHTHVPLVPILQAP
jgi:hypothetical protein